MPSVGIIIAGIIILVIVYAIAGYNNMVRYRENIKNAMGQIAAQIESRWDALSNLIQATKQYSDYEGQTLQEIVQARTPIKAGSSVQAVEKDDQVYRQAMNQINAVAEAYPDLKTSDLYGKTMDSVNQYEGNVRHARMIYNDTVTKFNRYIKTFPNVLIAGPFGFTEEDYFQASQGKAEMPSW